MPARASPSLDYDELERLGQLHANGTLTDEEFATAQGEDPRNVTDAFAAGAIVGTSRTRTLAITAASAPGVLGVARRRGGRRS